MSEKLPQYIARQNLCYSDLIADRDPDLVGKDFAKVGEVTELYPELRRWPDRIQILLNMGAIELIPETPVKPKPVKTEDKGE